VADEALLARCEAAVAGLYEIEAEIGRGGMAVVYRARDVRLRRRVAIKVLPPELAYRTEVRTRFLREAEMAARLSHPHIVPIYSVDETEGLVYFVMGLVDGESLASRLHHEPRPSLDFVRRVLREVADALGYAHGQGVVHRDIKPDNILLEASTGRALVTDFGIARAAEGDQRLTATGIAVGTPAYMSPEQAMGERAVDGRADLYALGIVGYQMLAGELPFQATNTPAMLMKHLSERPRPLAHSRDDLPGSRVHAIDRALETGREQRW
jgi:serine/threonine-protein kinase